MATVPSDQKRKNLGGSCVKLDSNDAVDTRRSVVYTSSWLGNRRRYEVRICVLLWTVDGVRVLAGWYNRVPKTTLLKHSFILHMA
jgi:hypothetical protein